MVRSIFLKAALAAGCRGDRDEREGGMELGANPMQNLLGAYCKGW